jgi:hypothetical protein
MEKPTEKPKTESKSAKIGLEYEIEVRDKNGKLLSSERGKAHSWVRNFIQILKCLLDVSDGGSSTVSLTDTSDNSNTFTGAVAAGVIHTPIGIHAIVTIDTYGIQVGTSDTAVSRTQNKLQAKISHGDGAGQLEYGEVHVDNYVETDSQAYLLTYRTFHNGSGNLITVKEIGIIIDNRTAGNSYFFMVARDVLGTPHDVPNGADMTVKYKLTISYS